MLFRFKKLFFLPVLVIGVLFVFTTVLAYANPGQPSGFVNDYAGVFSVDQKRALEDKLIQFEKESSNEIAVVTIKTLDGDTIENFASELFKDWGIGKKANDNGVLVLVAVDDRKMRIDVGYGLEGALTDAQSIWILNNVMRPAFRQNDYVGGINGAVDKIISVTKGEYVPSDTEKQNTDSGKSLFDALGGFLDFWVLGAFFLLSLGTEFLAKSKSWWLGGLIGLIIGVIILIMGGWLVGAIWTLILMPLGLLFDYLVSKQHGKYHATNKNPWWMGGSGRSGGSSSGGFGGFGGGGSGGGGASSSW